jgi:hypothetical protein
LLDSAGEPVDRSGLVVAIKVVGSEVSVLYAVAEDVVGGCQHRGGDGEDGLLGASASLNAEELGARVAVLLADGSPGGLDERRFEPGSALGKRDISVPISDTIT